MLYVRRIDPESRDHSAALHDVLDCPLPPGDAPPAHPVRNLLQGAHLGRSSIDLCLGAFDGDRFVRACLAVESPGGAALVLMSRHIASEPGSAAPSLLLNALHRMAETRRIALLETLVDPSAASLRRVLAASQFRRLARLIYLQRDFATAVSVAAPPVPLLWTTYKAGHERLFEQAVEESYVQSLDCPELTGVRNVADVMAGHRATGIFEPTRWWVAIRGTSPVGVILQNRIPSEQSVEIVYMGVSQPARGTGVADALLARAVGAGRANSDRCLSLAVDERNAPARRLYRRWAFEEIGVREAWIATP